VKQLVQFRLTGSFFAHAFKAAFRQHHREALPYPRKLIPPDGVVIDGGAHAGQFSKLYSGLAEQGHVFAFEPASYTRAVLRVGLLFSRRTNVTVIPMALSDQEGTQLLSMPIKKSGAVGFGLSHLGGESDLAERFDLRHDVVAVTTLDQFVEQIGLERLDLLKLDTEGFELRDLRGAETCISRFRPVIICELNAAALSRAGDTVDDVHAFFAEQGYLCFTGHEATDGKLEPTPGLVDGDYVFLPEERDAS